MLSLLVDILLLGMACYWGSRVLGMGSDGDITGYTRVGFNNDVTYGRKVC